MHPIGFHHGSCACRGFGEFSMDRICDCGVRGSKQRFIHQNVGEFPAVDSMLQDRAELLWSTLSLSRTPNIDLSRHIRVSRNMAVSCGADTN